jgi:hypothetical protein
MPGGALEDVLEIIFEPALGSAGSFNIRDIEQEGRVVIASTGEHSPIRAPSETTYLLSVDHNPSNDLDLCLIVRYTLDLLFRVAPGHLDQVDSSGLVSEKQILCKTAQLLSLTHNFIQAASAIGNLRLPGQTSDTRQMFVLEPRQLLTGVPQRERATDAADGKDAVFSLGGRKRKGSHMGVRPLNERSGSRNFVPAVNVAVQTDCQGVGGRIICYQGAVVIVPKSRSV